MPFAADHQRELKRQSARGRCLHFAGGSRCTELISAHSIQRAGQLSRIAETGHVYRLSADLSTLKAGGGRPQPKKTGVSKTSTFGGFCKQHDNDLFLPIDREPLRPTHEQVALYAYRSLCREYFVKENAVSSLIAICAHPQIQEPQRAILEAAHHGHSLGFSGIKHHKAIYDDCLLRQRQTEFHYTAFLSVSRWSIQLSGLLYPDYDFLGQQVQDLADWKSPLDLLTFFTAPTLDGWAFCFAWHESSSKTCVPLLRSLATLVHAGQKLEDALLRFAFSCCENHAIRISWWDSLAPEQKKIAIDRMVLMMHPSIPVSPSYLTAGCEGLADWSFEYVLASSEKMDC